MFGKRTSLAKAAKIVEPAPLPAKYAPYGKSDIDFIYNLLFCDDLSAFSPTPDQMPTPRQSILFAEPIDVEAVRSVAEDTKGEGRWRALAYNKLRMCGCDVPARKLLGTIIEMPLPEGLDVLATFSDGSIRYINKSGKMVFIEQELPALKMVMTQLLEASQKVVDKIGPWTKARLPPPVAPYVRLTFLVSDGLYFGEGPNALFARDALAGPVLKHAADLLQLVVNAAMEKSDVNKDATGH